MKKQLFIVCFALFSALLMAHGVSAYWEILQITNNELDDVDPDINNSGQAAWLMHLDENDHNKIYLYNGSETLCISENHNSQNDFPVINDNGHVVWEFAQTIQLFNGLETSTVSRSGWSSHFPDINNSGQIVWERSDGCYSEDSTHEIMLYVDPEVTPLTDNEVYDFKPSIGDNGHIFWAGRDPETFVDFYNGSSIDRIFTDDCAMYRVGSVNGYAVWTCGYPLGDIYLYNQSQTLNLTEDIAYDTHMPQVNANGWVTWQMYSFNDFENWDWEIMLYDGETITQLTDNELDESRPSINNYNQVVWQGHDGNDLEIFMYDNGKILQLTDNCYNDEFPTINDNGEVAWSGYDGNDFEIFLRRWQTAFPTTSAHTYGHLTNEGFSSVEKIGASDLIVAGETQGSVALPSDIWLSRLDNSGNVLWQKTYGGEELEGGAKILPTSHDNGILLAGETVSFGAGETDIWLLKLDGSGSVGWQKTFGGTQRDSVGDMLEIQCGGGYILAGGSMSYDAYNHGDVWVMKVDANGSVEWQKRYGTEDGGEGACAIEQTGDGGYIVSGTTYSYGSNNDIWLLKLDANGNLEWEKAYGSIWVETDAKISQTGDGGYIVACESFSFSADMNLSDIWVLKLDAAGDIVWQKAYILPYNNGLSAVAQTPYGDYVVAGNRAISYTGTTRHNQGLLMRLSAEGNVVWSKGYECSIDDLLVNDSGGFTAVGYSESFGMGQQDGCVLRLDEYGESADCDLTEALTVSVVSTEISALETSADVNDTTVTGTDTTATVADFSSYRRDICSPKPLISLPKTGQTVIYKSGDDGDLQSGVDWPNPRFMDNGDGTITDNLTGLTWLKDADCLNKRAWKSDGTDSYPADESIAYLNTNPNFYECAEYTGDHADWRMPSVNELYSLVNIGAENPAQWLIGQGFQDVQHATGDDGYWTSVEWASNQYYAFALCFYNYAFTTTTGKSAEYWVWPVRGRDDSLPDSRYPASVWASSASGGGGVMWPNPRLLDNGDGTVTDNLTGLMWLKDAECFDVVDWVDTFGLVDALSTASGCEGYTADYSDWRVPNQKELLSLVDYGNWRPSLPAGHPFIMPSGGITALSSSTVAGRDTSFYFVSLDTGRTKLGEKTMVGNSRVLPVRSPTLTVTFIEGENGAIVGDLVQYVRLGEDCTEVSANPTGGYRFVGWTGDYNGTENPLTITNVASHMTITANFLPDASYTVTFAAGENGTVTGDLEQIILHGGDCTQVTAVADEGYYFVGWEGSYSGTENPLTVKNVTSNMTITVRFLKETCFGDFDHDGDVDGVDLHQYVNRPDYSDLDEFAENFGRNDCFD